MGIRLTEPQRTTRQTTCLFEYTDDDGKLVENPDFRIAYYDWTISELRQLRSDAEARQKENPGQPPWYSETLARQIHSLPEIVDDKGKPEKITVELLDRISLPNLNRIREAIEQAADPKAPPVT